MTMKVVLDIGVEFFNYVNSESEAFRFCREQSSLYKDRNKIKIIDTTNNIIYYEDL